MSDRDAAPVPCGTCRYLQPDRHTWLGVRCTKGDAGDQCGDFSCYEARPVADDTWPPAWIRWTSPS